MEVGARPMRESERWPEPPLAAEEKRFEGGFWVRREKKKKRNGRRGRERDQLLGEIN